MIQYAVGAAAWLVAVNCRAVVLSALLVVCGCCFWCCRFLFDCAAKKRWRRRF